MLNAVAKTEAIAAVTVVTEFTELQGDGPSTDSQYLMLRVDMTTVNCCPAKLQEEAKICDATFHSAPDQRTLRDHMCDLQLELSCMNFLMLVYQ